MSARCKSCGASIFWATSISGKVMPLNAKPDPVGGNLVIDERGVARVITEGFRSANCYAGPPRYVSHFATCKHAATHRRPL